MVEIFSKKTNQTSLFDKKWLTLQPKRKTKKDGESTIDY